DSLRWTFQMTHKRYAEYVNSREGWSGHLWQERFYSSPVDEDYFWVALRYIERKPVEAGMVRHPADYPWSSAASRCQGEVNPLLTKDKNWNELLDSRTDWHQWLGQSENS